MAINFPSTAGQPTDGTFTYVVAGITYSWNGESWVAAGSGATATDLTVFSVTTNAVGTATLSYDSNTGVFSYTPPDLSPYYQSVDFENNVVLGSTTTGDAITTGAFSNVVIGTGAGSAITNQDNNVFIGLNAGAEDIGSYNVAIGPNAGDTSWGEFANVENVAVGRLAGDIRNGNGNTALGFAALSSSATSSSSFFNIALGYYAMGNYKIDGASYNTCIGQQTGYNLSSGDANLLIGDYAGFGITTGSNNVLIGTSAGDDITTGDNNVIINGGNYQSGTTSGFTANTSNSLWIGHSSYAWITGASSGNTRSVDIPGQLTAGGLTYPTSNGTSDQVLTSDGAGNVTWSTPGPSLSSRQTVTYTATNLNNGASVDFNVQTGATYALLKVETSHACWLTLYTDTTSRTNDASRSQVTDPSPGSGVIAEVITENAESQLITPGVIGFNAVGGSQTYGKLVNNSGTQVNLQVTLTFLPLED